MASRLQIHNKSYEVIGKLRYNNSGGVVRGGVMGNEQVHLCAVNESLFMLCVVQCAAFTISGLFFKKNFLP